MHTNRLRTLWIMFLSAIFMAKTCGHATIKRWRGTITRTWCDQELQRWANRMRELLRINLQINNPLEIKPETGKPTILMCNHCSLFDIPLSLLAFPHNSVRMLAKKELSRIPIMGAGMMAAEFPFIDRHNHRQALQDLSAVQDLLNSGIVMWIAPEGMRSRDGNLSKFKKGAFITAIKMGATIIPIGIRGADQICPAHTFNFNLNQTATVNIGASINAREYTLENKEDLMNRVFKTMQSLLEPSKSS